MDESIAAITMVTLSVLLSGGVLVVLMAMYQRTKSQEMAHRERMAMIEKGIAPGPAHDPAAFEAWQQRPYEGPLPRSTSVGIVTIALGLGLMLLIAFAAGAGDIAVGVGGPIVVLGFAFIVNGELKRRSQRPHVPASFRPPDATPPQPPLG